MIGTEAMTEAKIGEIVVEIPIGMVSWVNRKVGVLAKRAVKLGQEPPTVRFGDARKAPSPWDSKRFRWVVDATLRGTAPRIDGWVLLARIEERPVANLVLEAPGASCPEEYRTGPVSCDHCGASRRRKASYVLREESTGRVVQVGKNCLADFLRDPAAAEGILRGADGWEAVLDAVEEAKEKSGSHRAEEFSLTEDVVALAVRFVSHYGFVPTRSESDRLPTAYAVRRWISDAKFQNLLKEEFRAEVRENSAKDLEEARRIIAWVLSDQGPTGNYGHNLRTILSDEHLNDKDFGIACSAPAAYRRFVDGPRSKPEVERPVSKHVGKVGERIELRVQVRFVSEYEGGFGPSAVYAMSDEAGNDLVWFSTKLNQLSRDGSYRILATVKSHGERKERLQTVVTRVRVLEEIASGAENLGASQGEGS
jgi:hypothetical protein